MLQLVVGNGRHVTKLTSTGLLRFSTALLVAILVQCVHSLGASPFTRQEGSDILRIKGLFCVVNKINVGHLSNQRMTVFLLM